MSEEPRKVDNQDLPEDARLGLNDIKNVVVLIDVSAQRGTWKGDELSKVGMIRDRFAKIIAALEPRQENEQADEASAETEPQPEKAEG